MSLTVKSPVRPWARTHWAALVITVLCVLLAASLAVLAARLVSGSSTGISTSVVHVPEPVDNGCQLVGPGQPC
jgi:ABC-type spermidine/putrescine transport system permease subunit I